MKTPTIKKKDMSVNIISEYRINPKWKASYIDDQTLKLNLNVIIYD
jgi:hypothetical protein